MHWTWTRINKKTTDHKNLVFKNDSRHKRKAVCLVRPPSTAVIHCRSKFLLNCFEYCAIFLIVLFSFRGEFILKMAFEPDHCWYLERVGVKELPNFILQNAKVRVIHV
jgi:hypothetical protein